MSLENLVEKLIKKTQENRDKAIIKLENNEVIARIDGTQVYPEDRDEAWKWIKEAIEKVANIKNLENVKYTLKTVSEDKKSKSYNINVTHCKTNKKGDWSFFLEDNAVLDNEKVKKFNNISIKKKPKTANESILDIYESDIKGKFEKSEKVIKEQIEEKYKKWF